MNSQVRAERSSGLILFTQGSMLLYVIFSGAGDNTNMASKEWSIHKIQKGNSELGLGYK